MSERQTDLFDYDALEPNALFGDIRDFVGDLRGRVQNFIDGVNLNWWGESPLSLDTDRPIYVYQFVTAYTMDSTAPGYPFGNGRGDRSVNDGSPQPEVQFKTGIYTIGDPSQALRERIRDVDNSRLVTLFDTGPYVEYMSGFGFDSKKTYVQREEVSAREVESKGYGLGVPWFEVEAYTDNGELAGYADGYFNPFTTDYESVTTTTGSPTPQQEVWRFGARQSHESGDRYQISPPGRTGARERAKAAKGKTAYINGVPVGSILDGGRIRLKVAYTNPNRATYNSRRFLIEERGINYQALSEGARLFKTRETEDGLYFQTDLPGGDFNFDAPDPEDIRPDALGEETTTEEVTRILLDSGEPTTFTVESDEEITRLMGLYRNTPLTRDISEGTQLVQY